MWITVAPEGCCWILRYDCKARNYHCPWSQPYKAQPGRGPVGCRRLLWVVRMKSSVSRGNQLLHLVNATLSHCHGVTNKDGFAVILRMGESLLLFFPLLHPAPGALHPDRAVPPRGWVSGWVELNCQLGLNLDNELIQMGFRPRKGCFQRLRGA